LGADLAQTALSSVGLMADVWASTSPAHDQWSIEVRISAHAVVRIDIDDDAHDQYSIDRLELRAARTWRDVGRKTTSFESRLDI